MSFEELMTVEATSVSRTEETLRDAAAAVAVVTPEILRRSGATTIPDALRLVPGLHVGEQTSSSWAVSSRGFSSITSEKLLVLSDTRSIYTPLFSGVNWTVQEEGDFVGMFGPDRGGGVGCGGFEGDESAGCKKAGHRDSN
jgi:iron complex outermembrane receptor protein